MKCKRDGHDSVERKVGESENKWDWRVGGEPVPCPTMLTDNGGATSAAPNSPRHGVILHACSRTHAMANNKKRDPNAKQARHAFGPRGDLDVLTFSFALWNVATPVVRVPGCSCLKCQAERGIWDRRRATKAHFY